MNENAVRQYARTQYDFPGLFTHTARHVVYVGDGRRLWDFVCGRIERIVVHAHLRPIPPDILACDYENDPEAKKRIQSWVSELWAEKDALIEKISSEFAEPASRAA